MRISDWSSDVCSSDLIGKQPFLGSVIMIDKLLRLAAASSDIFHAGPFQTPLTKFAARGRDNGGNSVLRRPFGRNLLASHTSRSARMPVSIAGMQVGAQVR